MTKAKKIVKQQPKSKAGWIALGAVGLATAAITLGTHLYTSTPRYVVENDIPSRRSIPGERVEIGSTTSISLSKEARKRDLAAIINKSDNAGATRTEFKHAYAAPYVSFERNKGLASKLEKLGKDSIDHMAKFIDSPYLKEENPSFVVPQKASDIDSSNTNVVYLVASVGRKITANYRVELRNGKVGEIVTTEDDISAGENNISIVATAKERGFDITQQNETPIFYNTSQDKLSLIETFAIESLHKKVRRHTYAHMAKDLADIDRNSIELDKVVGKWAYNEEAFVHALSVLWLKQYNVDRHLGLTSEEIDARVQRYNREERYTGVAPTLAKIEKIGIKRAVEFYATNPEELFDSK